jgi:hypothetical protein
MADRPEKVGERPTRATRWERDRFFAMHARALCVAGFAKPRHQKPDTNDVLYLYYMGNDNLRAMTLVKLVASIPRLRYIVGSLK